MGREISSSKRSTRVVEELEREREREREEEEATQKRGRKGFKYGSQKICPLGASNGLCCR
jgi:hypothetical protein